MALDASTVDRRIPDVPASQRKETAGVPGPPPRSSVEHSPQLPLLPLGCLECMPVSLARRGCMLGRPRRHCQVRRGRFVHRKVLGSSVQHVKGPRDTKGGPSGLLTARG